LNATGLHTGAVDTFVQHNLSQEFCCARGGWSLAMYAKTETNMKSYVPLTPSNSLPAGLALQGYENFEKTKVIPYNFTEQ
jgi:hypothetical protein